MATFRLPEKPSTFIQIKKTLLLLLLFAPRGSLTIVTYYAWKGSGSCVIKQVYESDQQQCCCLLLLLIITTPFAAQSRDEDESREERQRRCCLCVINPDDGQITPAASVGPPENAPLRAMCSLREQQRQRQLFTSSFCSQEHCLKQSAPARLFRVRRSLGADDDDDDDDLAIEEDLCAPPKNSRHMAQHVRVCN